MEQRARLIPCPVILTETRVHKIVTGVALASILLSGSVTCAWSASGLTAGKKTLFAEDFELDIYEWTLLEGGQTHPEGKPRGH